MTRAGVRTVLGLCAALVGVAGLVLASTAGVGEPVKTRISYVVAPHPDDEWQAWSLVQDRPDVYHVFVVLTRGEASSYCAGGGYQGQYGERHPLPNAPTPNGFGAVGSDTCKAQRLDSWHTWLDAQAGHDRGLGTAAGMRSFRVTHPGDDATTAGTADWQVGPRSARVAFDLGDGSLTKDEVTWALRAVRDSRAQLPDLPEHEVIGAAYYNRLSSCYVYESPDHLQVQRALLETDLGVPGGQWGATCRDDPRVRRTGTIDDALYEANMAPVTQTPAARPAATRTGHFQVAYGWLGFPGDYFPSGTDNTVLFSQTQAFWRSH